MRRSSFDIVEPFCDLGRSSVVDAGHANVTSRTVAANAAWRISPS